MPSIPMSLPAAERRAVALATRSLGRTWPNPGVGCVLISAEGMLIGSGRHEVCGGPHGEVQALNDAERRGFGHLIAGATAVVTLAPCTKQGRTPPCTQTLIRVGVQRVIAGIADPNQDEAGELFAAAGVTYEVAAKDSWFGSACGRVHGGFLQRIQSGRPRITAKWAETADGFIARPAGGGAVSCPVARHASRHQRRRFDAIVVGAATVRVDNPSLLARPINESPQPIVVTASGQLPEDAALLASQPWVMCAEATILPQAWQAQHIWRFPTVTPAVLAQCWGDLGLNEVLLEGGPALQRQFFATALVDRLQIDRSQETWQSGIPGPLVESDLHQDFQQISQPLEFGVTRFERWYHRRRL